MELSLNVPCHGLILGKRKFVKKLVNEMHALVITPEDIIFPNKCKLEGRTQVTLKKKDFLSSLQESNQWNQCGSKHTPNEHV